MQRMRGVVVDDVGSPEVLKVKSDLKIPKPKDGQILVRNAIIGVNYIDIYFRNGAYSSQKPEILGREAVGTVVRVGTGETYGLKEGDRVCFIGPGAYAEYTATSALHAFKVPDRIPDRMAAGAYMQGLAALSIMSEAYEAKRGDWALVHAAAGGVGLWLCQLLARHGVNVVGTVSTEQKQRLALQHGARAVLFYNQDEIVQKIHEVTQGKGVDVVFDGVGQDTLNTDLAVLRRKGTLIMHGTSSGEPRNFKVGWLTPKNLKFIKPTFMNYLTTRPEVTRYATEVFNALSTNSISVHVTKEYPLQDVRRAHEDMESRSTTGKLLLKL